MKFTEELGQSSGKKNYDLIFFFEPKLFLVEKELTESKATGEMFLKRKENSIGSEK